jgi:beta-glucosidase
VTRPVKELKGFQRVTLQPGQRTQVRFQIGAKELGFHNQQMKFVVEPGEFKIMVGPNSAELIEKSFQVTGP